MTYARAEFYLLSLGNEVAAMKLGLENIRKLLDKLGNPHENYLKVQVAGTNGKGSVCAFLDSICREANIKTGLYTSPHLISITERVRIDGVDISEDEFARIATHVRETAETMLANGELEYRPTFFEQMTAIALVAFAEANVELAILETGLGGRLDATTAANAEIVAITRIDLDHQQYLGDTIEEIAAEKAAIIHSDLEAVVIGRQSPNVMQVIESRIQQTATDRDRTLKRNILWVGESRAANGSTLGLAGSHQVENATVAIFLAEMVSQHFPRMTNGDMSYGLAEARHPGRLERVGRFLFDGAHNLGGAEALATFISESERSPITMIFGAMNDKNVAEILAVLAPLADKIVLTESSNTRSLSYDELLKHLPKSFSRERTFASDNVEHAMDIAETVTAYDSIILVTGSLYLVGEVKAILRSQI